MGIVYQEFNLLPDRNVAENVFIGREPRKGPIVDGRKMERDTAALLEEVGESGFGPRTPVRWLSVAQQQVVEIIKARSLNAKILVLDEPTAALAEGEVELLFKLVRRLQELGVGILYISHRLREVFALSDRITVIKDGGVVKTLDTASTNQRELVNLMVGRELDGYFPEKGAKEDLGDVRLAVKGLTTPLLRDVNFDVRAGEIVGLAGLQGSGRTEIARAVFGADPVTAGTVEIDGQARRFKHPRQAIKAGLGFITEDRKAEGLALAQSIADNMMLAVRTVMSPRKRRAGAGHDVASPTWRRSPSCVRAAPSRKSASSQAATSRRSCSPSGCRRSRRSSSSTSRRAASTSAPRPASTTSSASSPRTASPS